MGRSRCGVPAYVEATGTALVDTTSWDIEAEVDSVLVTIYTPHDEIEIRVAEPGVARGLVMSKLDLTPRD